MTTVWKANPEKELEKDYECKVTTVYKRPKEEDTFECGKCHLVYRESWFPDTEKGWCPGCGEAIIPEVIVRYEAPKRIPNTPERKKYLKQAALEAQLAEMDYQKFVHESTPVVENITGSGIRETKEDLRNRHVSDLGKLAYADKVQKDTLFKLAVLSNS